MSNDQNQQQPQKKPLEWCGEVVPCYRCNGGGYVPDPTRRLSWRGDRMCKCNKCDFGHVWYKYNLHTKKWINQRELYA